MNLETLDLGGLLLFALALAITAASAVLLGGFLPLSARGPRQRGPLAAVLLPLALLALLALGAGALLFAGRLPIAAAVVAGGLGLLAGPLLFQALPARLRDGAGGLFLVVLAGGALAALLYGAA